ncbi:MAG: response regulator transcription factor [Campylobacterales bacterium]|nr:response regulator transcription factor [Campylobacterales bacterium]
MKLEDLSVLYAEDEIKIQETITEVLELYVDNVICAKDGEEALDLYNTYKPNILLLDICMPKIDGLKVLKKIREKDLLTPVIIMTAHTEQEYLLDAVELYITKYLIKPFNKNDLVNALDECLNVLYKKQENKIKLNKKIEFNLLDNTIIKDEKKIQLNKKESLLLNLLIKSTPNIVSYEEIEYHLWQDTYVSKEAFKSIIKDLRKKTSKELIKNISQIGYKIEIS